MKYFVIVTLGLLLVLCDPTRANPLTRVRRQGWAWGGNDGSNRPLNRPSSSSEQPWQPTRTTPSSSANVEDPNSTTTTASPAFTQCMNNCQTTKQYNPVCGSNRVTYDNASRLKCARDCGVDVDVLFNGTCSPVTR